VSLIGTLEQLRLPNVLQRIEAHEKSGLLVVRQRSQWVEFYFRAGQLLCIGPVRTNATLLDRLLRESLVSQQVWQEINRILGTEVQNEARVAQCLIEGGFITRDQLRSWSIEKCWHVLRAILVWSTGDIYFEENTQPPDERLLVTVSATSLIDSLNTTPLPPLPAQLASALQKNNRVVPGVSTTQEVPPPAKMPNTSPSVPALAPNAFLRNVQPTVPIAPVKLKGDIARVPTLTVPSQFLKEKSPDSVVPEKKTSLSETESFVSFPNRSDTPNSSLPNTNEINFASLIDFDAIKPKHHIIQPEIVNCPTPPKHVDTTFMQPEMVIVPANFSSFRDQNRKIQITPNQWRLLTCVDARSSLQSVCHSLGLTPEAVCKLAGELVAEGLIYVVPPDQVQVRSSVLDNHGQPVTGATNSYVAPGYIAGSASPWSASAPALPSTDAIPNPYTVLPFETESQWGNGGNGATFIPGRGWITPPQQMQPLHSVGR
jgi:hypothetical protein